MRKKEKEQFARIAAAPDLRLAAIARMRAAADAEALARADDESRVVLAWVVGRPLTQDEIDINADIRERNPDAWDKATERPPVLGPPSGPSVIVERLSFRNTGEQAAVIARHLAEGYVLQQQSERTSRWTSGGVVTLTFVRPTGGTP